MIMTAVAHVSSDCHSLKGGEETERDEISPVDAGD